MEIWRNIQLLFNRTRQLIGFHLHPYLMIGILGSTFVVANVIAWLLYYRQQERIQKKTKELAAQKGKKPIPVTILTGFLGSGKTTILNEVLTTALIDKRIMVIENEIGKIAIDHHLVVKQKKRKKDAEIIVMENGCMCCSVQSSGNELERILDHLIQLASLRQDEENFDYVLIETTGLADPGPIIKTFLQLKSRYFVLDSVIAMVDSNAFLKHYNDKDKRPIEFERQLLYSDACVLTKVDLLSQNDVQDVVQRFETEYPEMTLYTSSLDAPIHVNQLIDTHSFDSERFHRDSAINFQAEHTTHVSSIFIAVDGRIKSTKFLSWLKGVVNMHVNQPIFRLKGIIHLEDDLVVVQCVLDTFTIVKYAHDDKRKDQHRNCCKLVVIGQHLDKQAIQKGFLECFSADARKKFYAKESRNSKKKD